MWGNPEGLTSHLRKTKEGKVGKRKDLDAEVVTKKKGGPKTNQSVEKTAEKQSRQKKGRVMGRKEHKIFQDRGREKEKKG